MAELLIYDKSHWMDGGKYDLITVQLRIDADSKMTAAQKIKNKELAARKFNSRYQKGDIIEVRPDGFWDHRGFGEQHFALIKLPGQSEKKLAYLTDSLDTLDVGGEPATARKRKYAVPAAALIEKVLTIAPADQAAFLGNITEKKLEAQT